MKNGLSKQVFNVLNSPILATPEIDDVTDLKTVCTNPASCEKAAVLNKKEEIKMDQNVENEVVTDVSFNANLEKDAEIDTLDLVEQKPVQEEPTLVLAEKPVETPPVATVSKDNTVNPDNPTCETPVEPEEREGEVHITPTDESGSEKKLPSPGLNEEDIRKIVNALLPEITMILKKAISEELEAKKSLCERSKELMTPEDLIKYTGLGKSVVYRLLQSGAIPSQRSGDGKRAKYLVRKSAVDEFLTSSCSAGKVKVRGKSSSAA